MDRARIAIMRIKGTRLMNIKNIGKDYVQKNVNEFRPELEEFGVLNILKNNFIGNEQVDMLQLDTGKRLSLEDTQADKKILDALNNVWNDLGIKAEQVETIMKDGVEINAVAKANVVTNLIEYIDGKRDLTTLPEETTHIIVRLMQGTPLYNTMYNKIANTGIYNEVVEEYSELYKGDELMLREEAIGKAIAQVMVKENQRRLEEGNFGMFRKWVLGIMKALKDMFRKAKEENPFQKAALLILDNNVKRLINKQNTKLEGEDVFYQVDNSQEIQALSDQQRHEEQLEQYKAIRDSKVRVMLNTGNTSETQKVNNEELSKVNQITSKEEIINDQLTNFNKYYSAFADNIRSEGARRLFIEKIMNGELKIIC
jgi:hypothetical protein